MNTVLLKAEDVGTWRNYVGYFLLLLALIETVYFFSIFFEIKSHEKVKYFFLKVFAVTMPFYFVYIPLLQEDRANLKIRKLWKYVFIGFVSYIVVFMIIKT